MKKYEDTDILIKTNVEKRTLDKNNKQFINFRVYMKNNGHRKTHDYLLAMALGYDVDPIVVDSSKTKKKNEKTPPPE